MATDGTVTLGTEIDETGIKKDLNDLEKEIEVTAKVIEEDLKLDADIDTKNAQKDLDNLNTKSKDTSKVLDGVSESADGAMGNVTKVGMAATVAAGGLLLVGDAADTAVGNMDRVESVFGDAAIGMEAVTTAAEDLGNQLGVASQDILMAGASMAVTAENMGMAEEAAEKYGVAVAKLSAVSASYLNIPMAEAAERVSAAIN